MPPSLTTTTLTMVRGDTEAFAFSVSGLGSSGLNAYNDIRFSAKRDVTDADGAAIIAKSLSSGIVVTTPGNASTPGVLTVSLAPADTQALPTAYARTLTYDVRVYDASGDAYTVAQGTLMVTPTATQATT